MKLATAITAIALTATAAIAQNNPALKPLLAQLDTAHKSFHSAQADLNEDIYTYVVRAHDTQTGSTFIDRSGSSVSMGLAIFDPGSKTPSKVVNFDGATLQMYTPGTNQDDIFKSGSNSGTIESFLTLGFGVSGTELDKAWKITDQGPETIDGVKTEKLDLVSNDPNVTSKVKSITIWIDPVRDVSLKQVFTMPNKDVRTTLYTNVRLNASINKKPYSIPSKATRVPH